MHLQLFIRGKVKIGIVIGFVAYKYYISLKLCTIDKVM